ncbi:unnamed protein product [Effrenium voratum]|uniref:CSD domain-containing protein n=1 Tax=Effrenium voratum TaxID=2562239 RepID=A0AA36NB10_9DINO|nr:unnamed protein product [Effrenium voratum]CAJ1455581.1 unnamed protein product [Effrenium voratum]
MSAAQVPGVTDRRWEGVIATVRQDKGFGFIRCPELRKMYPEKDVFLHQRHLGSFREGDNVSFGVFMRDGKPQATDLAMVNGQQPMQQQQQMAPQMGMQMGMPMGQGVPMQGMGMGMGMGMQMDMGMQQPSMGHPQMGQQALPPPPPQAPPEEEATHEVEVPKEFMSTLGEGGRSAGHVARVATVSVCNINRRVRSGLERLQQKQAGEE